MRSPLARLRARVSALLVTVSASAPAGPVVLSLRAGAASTDNVARGAAAGVGGLAVGLKACAGSVDDVARVGMVGTRAATHEVGALAGVGARTAGTTLEDAARLGARTAGTTLEDTARFGGRTAGTTLDDAAHAGATTWTAEDAARAHAPFDESALGARHAPASEGGAPHVAGEVAGHAGDALDVAQAVAGDDGDDPGGEPAARPAPPTTALAPPAWRGRWTSGGLELDLAPDRDEVRGTFVYGGRPHYVSGRLDARGVLDAWCFERGISSHVELTLGPGAETVEVQYLAGRVTLRRQP